MTQIRLRMKLDDNNDRLANSLMLYSGDAVSPSDHPILIVTYWIPPT